MTEKCKKSGSSMTAMPMQEVDTAVEPIKRIADYLSKGNDLDYLNIDGYKVEFGWIDSADTLQDKISKIFAS